MASQDLRFGRQNINRMRRLRAELEGVKNAGVGHRETGEAQTTRFRWTTRSLTERLGVVSHWRAPDPILYERRLVDVMEFLRFIAPQINMLSLKVLRHLTFLAYALGPKPSPATTTRRPSGVSGGGDRRSWRVGEVRTVQNQPDPTLLFF